MPHRLPQTLRRCLPGLKERDRKEKERNSKEALVVGREERKECKTCKKECKTEREKEKDPLWEIERERDREGN